MLIEVTAELSNSFPTILPGLYREKKRTYTINRSNTSLSLTFPLFFLFVTSSYYFISLSSFWPTETIHGKCVWRFICPVRVCARNRFIATEEVFFSFTFFRLFNGFFSLFVPFRFIDTRVFFPPLTIVNERF